MAEAVNPEDNTPMEESVNPGGLEELKEEDAAIEIDFDSDFESPESSDQPNEGSDTASGNESDPAAESGNGNDAAPDIAVVAQLETQIASLKVQLEERTSQYLRITADFENFRKRTSREKEELETQIKCNTISNLLEVVDNFERARSQLKPEGDGEMAIHKSYQGVYKQLVEALKRLGVSPMRAEGQEFDPNLHEAVMREPTHDYEEGIVIEQFVRGYLLGERVLRHAMVKVAAPPEDDAEEGTSSSNSSEG